MFSSSTPLSRQSGDCCNTMHLRPMRGRCRSLAPLLAACGILIAAPAMAVDLDEMTVVTLARDGSWGVATASSQGEAIAAAVSACRAKAGGPSDCGAHFATTRHGWVMASLCGDRAIIVVAASRDGAEQASLERESEIRRVYAPDLSPCRRVLTVDPSGGLFVGDPRDPGGAEAARQAG